jgi:surface protein
MNSLQDLNNFGATAIDVADSRPAGVVFDRLFPSVPEDQILTITSTSVAVGPGIEIEEIINYDLADVRYQIEIFSGSGNPLPASSLDWTTLPSGVTVSQVGDVYTISGLTSDQDWREVRNFIWDLPNDYLDYPLWYLEASIIYYDQELDQELTKSWVVYDPRFYYFAQLEAESNIIANAKIRYSATINMSAVFTQREFFIEMSGKFSMVTVANEFEGVGPITLSSSSAITATAYDFDKASANITCSSSLTATSYNFVKGVSKTNSSAFTLTAQRLRIRRSAVSVSSNSSITCSLTPAPMEIVWSMTWQAGLTTATMVVSGTNLTVDWDDLGSSGGGVGARISYPGTLTNQLISYTYVSKVETHRVKISGDLTAITPIGPTTGGQKIKAIDRWIPGLQSFSMSRTSQTYYHDLFLTVPSYIPSSLTNLSRAFYQCINFIPSVGGLYDEFGNGGIRNWNTSNVTNMSEMFASYNTSDHVSVDALLEEWDTSNVTNMSRMFRNVRSFGSADLTSWDTSSVTNMERMFEAAEFNQDISSWDTSSVTNMRYMFLYTRLNQTEVAGFNQPIGSWNTANVTDMTGLFGNCRWFNQPIGSWNTAKVTSMAEMFENNFSFNQPLARNGNSWNTALVTDMSDMFRNSAFDQNISNWCVPLISSKPSGFDDSTTATWTTAEKPVWGTCP